jgi:hypothetical protein
MAKIRSLVGLARQMEILMLCGWQYVFAKPLGNNLALFTKVQMYTLTRGFSPSRYLASEDAHKNTPGDRLKVNTTTPTGGDKCRICTCSKTM